MLAVIVCKVSGTWAPVNDKLSLVLLVLHPVKSYINCFWHALFYCFVRKPTAVVLFTASGVKNWGWIIYSRHTRMGRASPLLMYPAPISASAAELVTFFMILLMAWMGSLRGHSAKGVTSFSRVLRKMFFCASVFFGYR